MNRLMHFLFVFITLSGLASASFGQQQEITGAGAAFPHALYSKMFGTYGREYGVKVNYQVVGSGGGLRLLIEKTIDFGASDRGASIPDLPITVVHRSDGSGTTFILSEYLCKASRDWRETVGSGMALNWPTGLWGRKGIPAWQGW